MKLAEDWMHGQVAVAKIGPFHDEVEEVDEVDEAEDGCGGVEWQKYVLTRPHTSNKLLHELAREIRGVEKRPGDDAEDDLARHQPDDQDQRQGEWPPVG